MVIDVTNVEVETEERTYIKREGDFVLKVVKVTEGTSSGGHPEFKVHMVDKAGHYTIDTFVVTPNSMWRVKLLTKAFKLPNIVDTALLVDRYVVASIRKKKTQNGEIFEVKGYTPSKLTNTYVLGELPATGSPEIEVNEDAIPF